MTLQPTKNQTVWNFPILYPIRRLLESRSFILAVLFFGILVTAEFRPEIKPYIDSILAVILGLFLKMGAEDIAKTLASRPHTPTAALSDALNLGIGALLPPDVAAQTPRITPEFIQAVAEELKRQQKSPTDLASAIDDVLARRRGDDQPKDTWLRGTGS